MTREVRDAPQFYLTAPSACPYLPGQHERKIFTHLVGKRAAALNPIYGADKILRFLAGITRKNPALTSMQVRPTTVNGLAGLVLREDDGAIDTLAFEHDGGRIVAIYVVRNPEKLRHVHF